MRTDKDKMIKFSQFIHNNPNRLEFEMRVLA